MIEKSLFSNTSTNAQDLKDTIPGDLHCLKTALVMTWCYSLNNSEDIMSYFDSWPRTWGHIPRLWAIFARVTRRGHISLSGRDCYLKFHIKRRNNEFIILHSFFMTFCTSLQCFPKNSFVADIVRTTFTRHQTCLSACTTLMTVLNGQYKRHVRMRIFNGKQYIMYWIN